MAYDYRGTVAASGDSAMWTDAHTSVAVPCILHAQPVGNYVESIPVSVFSLLVLAAGINLCFHLYYIGADARTQARKAPPANPTPDTVGAGKAVFLLGSTIGSAFGEFVLSWALVLSIAVSMCTGILIWGTMVPAPATALDTDDYNAVAQGGLGGLMCLVAAIAVFLFLPEPRYRSGVVLFGDPQDTDAGTPATGKHFPQDTNNSALSVSVGYIWSVHLAIMFPFWCMGWQVSSKFSPMARLDSALSKFYAQVLIGSRQLSSIATTGALNLAGGLATLPIDFLAPLLTEIYRKVHRRHSQRFTSAGAIIAAILLLHVTSVVLFASALAIAAPLLPEVTLPVPCITRPS